MRRPFQYATAAVAMLIGGAGLYFLLHADAAGAGDSAAEPAGPYSLQGDILEALDSAAASAGVSVAKVEPVDEPMALTLTARSGLNMETVTHVSPQFAGKVVDIGVGLGDRVNGPETGKPTRLCVIESNDLAQDKANWLQALIQVRIDEESLRRTQELYRANVLAKKFLLDAESTLMKDQAAQEAARQQLLIFGLKDKEIDDIRNEALLQAENVKGGGTTTTRRAAKSTDEIRRERMGYAIMSPRTGVIAEKLVAGGEIAMPGNNLFTVADTKTMWVWGDVYEKDLSRVTVGEKMRVYFTSEPKRERKCTVDWISPVLDPTTHAIKIRGLIDDNSDGHLLSDMYGTMIITVSEGKASLLLPADAIVHEESQAYVFVRAGTGSGKTRYRRTPVSVEPIDVGFGASATAAASAGSAARNTGSQASPSGIVRIVEGVHSGDAVVVSGAVGLFTEMKEQADLQGPGRSKTDVPVPNRAPAPADAHPGVTQVSASP